MSPGKLHGHLVVRRTVCTYRGTIRVWWTSRIFVSLNAVCDGMVCMGRFDKLEVVGGQDDERGLLAFCPLFNSMLLYVLRMVPAFRGEFVL